MPPDPPPAYTNLAEATRAGWDRVKEHAETLAPVPEPSVYDLLAELRKAEAEYHQAADAMHRACNAERKAGDRRRAALKAMAARLEAARRPVGVIVDGRLCVVQRSSYSDYWDLYEVVPVAMA